MTPLEGRKYLPGDTAPFSRAYQELDPSTWQPVRRLLVSRGDVFPDTRSQGGFFTPLDRVQNAPGGGAAAPSMA